MRRRTYNLKRLEALRDAFPRVSKEGLEREIARLSNIRDCIQNSLKDSEHKRRRFYGFVASKSDLYAVMTDGARCAPDETFQMPRFFGAPPFRIAFRKAIS